MNPVEPHWTAYASPLVSLLTAIIAACVAIMFGRVQAKIARQQADTARSKLQLELFERRLVVYNAVMDAWRHAVTQGSFPERNIDPYLHGTNGVRWLFEEEVVKYVQTTFFEMLIELETANTSLFGARQRSDEARIEASDARAMLFRQMSQQSHVIDALFMPYLKLKH